MYVYMEEAISYIIFKNEYHEREMFCLVSFFFTGNFLNFFIQEIRSYNDLRTIFFILLRSA